MHSLLRRFFFVGFALPLVVAHAADSAVPFRTLSFDVASAAAKAEGKLVFIDFYTTWCEPCKRLDAVTWTDAAVGKLVGDKAVALKIDAEKEGLALAKRYKISAYPTLLLLKPDGTEVDRIIGFREAVEFTGEFKNLLALAQSGKTAIEQAKAAVAQQAKPEVATSGEPEDAQPHFDLARKLVTAGQQEEALKELVWCWDEGKKDPEFSRTRSTLVTRELGRLARDYPPAREVMVVRRDQARERAIANKGGTVVIQDLIALNKELRAEEDTLAVFDQIPAGDRRRVTIAIYLFDLLVEKKRYADATLFNMPETNFMRIEQTRAQMKKMADGPGGDTAAQGFLRFTVTSTAKRVEALAGAGLLDQARELGDRLLALDGSEETKELLQKHVARAGQPDLFAGPAVAIPKKS